MSFKKIQKDGKYLQTAVSMDEYHVEPPQYKKSRKTSGQPKQDNVLRYKDKRRRSHRQQELYTACREGDIKQVKQLLAEAAINSHNSKHEALDIKHTNKNCLYEAVDKGHRNIVREFLSYKDRDFFILIEPLFEDYSQYGAAESKSREVEMNSLHCTAHTKGDVKTFLEHRKMQLSSSQLLALIMRKMPDLSMLVLNEYVYDVDDDADLDDDGDGDGDGGGCDDDDSAVDMLNDHEARVGTYRFKYNLFDSKEHTESCKKYVPKKYKRAINGNPLRAAYEADELRVKDHPLVASLLYYKWRKARPLYYAVMFWYAMFAAMITTFIMCYHDDIFQKNSICFPKNPAENDTFPMLTLTDAIDSSDYFNLETITIFSIALGVVACLGLLVEIIQLIVMRNVYFLCFSKSIGSAIDITMYISTILFCFPPWDRTTVMNQCHHWNLGIYVMFCSWFQLLLHHPLYGTYLFIMLKVIKDLGRFTIMYIIFLFTFALGFFALLRNQDAFNSIPSSILRTWTMMIGDIGYNAIYHPAAEKEHVQNTGALTMLFFLFLFLSIIITNMWTGFIINHMADIEKRVPVMRHRIQLDFIFLLESYLPACLQTCFTFSEPEAIYKCRPDDQSTWNPYYILKWFMRVVLGDTICIHFEDKIQFHKHKEDWTDKTNVLDNLLKQQSDLRGLIERYESHLSQECSRS